MRGATYWKIQRLIHSKISWKKPRRLKGCCTNRPIPKKWLNVSSTTWWIRRKLRTGSSNSMKSVSISNLWCSKLWASWDPKPTFNRLSWSQRSKGQSTCKSLAMSGEINSVIFRSWSIFYPTPSSLLQRRELLESHLGWSTTIKRYPEEPDHQ